MGGLSQFKDATQQHLMQRELPPGYMAIFSDMETFHCTTSIVSADGLAPGYRDVIVLSF
jgi:hypothetical protein